MKGNLDLGVIEFTSDDMKDTPEEIKRKLERQEKELENKLMELEEEKKSLQEVGDTGLEIVDAVGLEDRNATALGILEKEKQMQEEREKEWKKEKRNMHIKRFFWIFGLSTICVVIFLAWLSGYRIPIPQSWVTTIQEIYTSAYNFVVNYFSGGTAAVAGFFVETGAFRNPSSKKSKKKGVSVLGYFVDAGAILNPFKKNRGV